MKRAWHFIAGDSRSTSAAVACALIFGVAGTHANWPSVSLAAGYAGILVAGLALSVFE
ncbi:MAG: hypothetical protein ACLPYS_13115 [Vulcanimicrobiaceae bacterium]